MADGDEFRVNGNLISWPDIIVKVNSSRFYGLVAVSYADKRERVKGYGQGRHYGPRGRTRGKYTVDPVKITLYKQSAMALRKMIAALSESGTSYGDPEFPLSIQYVSNDGEPIHLQFERCTISGDSSSDDENPDPSKDEIELDVMRIVRNGLTLFGED